MKPCKKKNCNCGCPGKTVFSDRAIIAADQSMLSVRDGVYEYLGFELGIEPAHKIFTVYRSPSSVKEIAVLMDGLPITDGHVTLEHPPDEVLGTVDGAEIIPFEDESVKSTVMIKNKLASSGDVLQLNQSGKNELSLGFKANLIDHDVYDFEQTEFEPHHLAVLERGRCGTACGFIDRQPEKENLNMKKFQALQKVMLSFIDADGEVTLQQVMEMVAALPDAIRSAGMEDIQKLAPSLKEIIEAAQSKGVPIVEEAEAADGDDVEAEEVATEDGDDVEEEHLDADADKAEAAKGSTALGDLIAAERGDVTNEQLAEAAGRDVDTIENIVTGNVKTPPREVLAAIGKAINVSLDKLIDALPDDKEDEVAAEDQEPSDEEKLAMADGVLLFSDAQVKQAFADHSVVVEKARKFVDEIFDFTGKSTLEIQRAVLDQYTDQKFTDAEVATAFKLLQPGKSMYTEFADKDASGKLDEIADKEM